MKNIKVIEKKGIYPGKNVVVLAGVHGNESFGVRMLEKVIPNLKIVRGKVNFIFANLEAIKQDKRFVEYNLNRCFYKNQPVKIVNTLEGKTAREIIPYLDEADLMLDVHASNNPESVEFVICMPQSFEFANILPFEKVSWNWDEFEPGSTDYYMNLQKKVGICIECGYTKDKESEKRGEKALMNFLINSGSINGYFIGLKKQTYFKIVDLYKNKNVFKKFKDFDDFGKLNDKTLIGFDGDKKVYANEGDFLLFVKDSDNLGDECFLVAREETLLNKESLNKEKRNGE
ncbi:MAG: succinylglutamate desuccinylase/aspartoacylase family protein [Nanoarchaeota archaeon]|nr:succinylglutamate desuccinylase/aspartoacylase family protein [Nanoarchaeota archaeon]